MFIYFLCLCLCYCVLASDWWESWADTNASRPLNITICTQVTYGAPYMFEWIEYHATLGVTKFVVYDAGSAGELTRLAYLYSQRRGPHFITIVKARNDQTTNFRQCVTDYRHESDWFAIIDSDEFFVFPDTSPIFRSCRSCACDSSQTPTHSPPHTLALFLQQVPPEVGRLYVRAARFGANGWATPSPYFVARKKSGRAYLNPDNVTQLVTEIHTVRGPHNQLDGPRSWGTQRFSPAFRVLCNETTKQFKDITQRVCGHGLGKSLVRAGFAWTIPDETVPDDVGRFIHRFPTYPDRTPYRDYLSMLVLRIHHYSLRNFAEASPSHVWKHLAVSKARRVQADAFFNTVADRNATCYMHLLRSRLALLQDHEDVQRQNRTIQPTR